MSEGAVGATTRRSNPIRPPSLNDFKASLTASRAELRRLPVDEQVTVFLGWMNAWRSFPEGSYYDERAVRDMLFSWWQDLGARIAKEVRRGRLDPDQARSLWNQLRKAWEDRVDRPDSGRAPSQSEVIDAISRTNRLLEEAIASRRVLAPTDRAEAASTSGSWATAQALARPLNASAVRRYLRGLRHHPQRFIQDHARFFFISLLPQKLGSRSFREALVRATEATAARALAPLMGLPPSDPRVRAAARGLLLARDDRAVVQAMRRQRVQSTRGADELRRLDQLWQRLRPETREAFDAYVRGLATHPDATLTNLIGVDSPGRRKALLPLLGQVDTETLRALAKFRLAAMRRRGELPSSTDVDGAAARLVQGVREHADAMLATVVAEQRRRWADELVRRYLPPDPGRIAAFVGLLATQGAEPMEAVLRAYGLNDAQVRLAQRIAVALLQGQAPSAEQLEAFAPLQRRIVEAMRNEQLEHVDQLGSPMDVLRGQPLVTMSVVARLGLADPVQVSQSVLGQVIADDLARVELRTWAKVTGTLILMLPSLMGLGGGQFLAMLGIEGGLVSLASKALSIAKDIATEMAQMRRAAAERAHGRGADAMASGDSDRLEGVEHVTFGEALRRSIRKAATGEATGATADQTASTVAAGEGGQRLQTAFAAVLGKIAGWAAQAASQRRRPLDPARAWMRFVGRLREGG